MNFPVVQEILTCFTYRARLDIYTAKIQQDTKDYNHINVPSLLYETWNNRTHRITAAKYVKNIAFASDTMLATRLPTTAMLKLPTSRPALPDCVARRPARADFHHLYWHHFKCILTNEQ